MAGDLAPLGCAARPRRRCSSARRSRSRPRSGSGRSTSRRESGSRPSSAAAARRAARSSGASARRRVRGRRAARGGGTLLQILLRNPLADPTILGVSGAAAVGAMVGLALGTLKARSRRTSRCGRRASAPERCCCMIRAAFKRARCSKC
ncbi:MAG: iron chelate uptake ABC transporter family permease subunit [Burkholderiales bacterium]